MTWGETVFTPVEEMSDRGIVELIINSAVAHANDNSAPDGETGSAVLNSLQMHGYVLMKVENKKVVVPK